MKNTQNNTKAITGIVRLSFANVWEPKSINGGKPKYSASIIIPKNDTKTVEDINRAIDNAIEAGTDKLGSNVSKSALKLPLRDGDTENDNAAYRNSYFINANSAYAPKIVDRALNPIENKAEVYSGCYVRVSLNFYAYNYNGNKGIACGLGNIQKIRDGERLGKKRAVADEFTAFTDKSFEDFFA